MRVKNIGWYTRDGHLDFFARLSIKLRDNGNKFQSHYICHNRFEEEKLNIEYNIQSCVLGDYLIKRKNSFVFSKEKLNELEKRYKFIPLRRLLWSEMHQRKYTEEKMIFNLISHFEFWEKFVINKKIDGIVSERPSILSTSVLWVVCKQYGVQFVDFINIGIDGRIVFSSSWNGDIDSFEEKFKTIIIDKNSNTYKDAITYFQKGKAGIEKPKYISLNLATGEEITGNKLYRSFPKIGNVFTLPSRLYRSKKMFSYYLNESITKSLSSLLMLYYKSLFHYFINIFDKNLDLTRERYFLFTLHILGEWSNYPWMGLKYPNIISLIREISSCLPLGCKLYVKEHTTNFPERELSFYRTIKKLPRVRLVDRYGNTSELLKNSEGVITLGGTIGWEGFLLGKPVIIIGEAWYKHLPGIYKAESNERLVELLQIIKDLPLATDKDKIKAIYSLYDLSFQAARYPIVDLIAPENIEKYIVPFESWLRDKVKVDEIEETEKWPIASGK